MRIKILKPGLLSTIQDLGRIGSLSQAVPASGAMDELSASVANMSIGNTGNAATIEFTYGSASFITETALLIAYAGGGASLKVDGMDLPRATPIWIPAGNTITVENNVSGCRIYLAIAGGWDVPDVLGSKSTFLAGAFGGFEGRALRSGDQLNGAAELSELSQLLQDQLRSDSINYPRWSIAQALILPEDRHLIRVIPAREFTWFDSDAILSFLSDTFFVGTSSNRMGYQLEGKRISRRKNDELLSTAVCPGTIQVTGEGKMILLMADCQTTGGYPRIGQVAAVDLPIVAQLKPGDPIRFTEISMEDADLLLLEREGELDSISRAIEMKINRK